MEEFGAEQPPKMDAAYIAEHHIAANYLAGRLPPRYVTEFERFCRENPKLVDATGLPERVNSGVRLLDISGLKQPWDPEPPQFWQRLEVVLPVAGLCLLFAIGTWYFYSAASQANTLIASLQKRLADDGSKAITGTELIKIEPDRLRSPSKPQFEIDLTRGPKWLELHFNMAWHRGRLFRVSIERESEGREFVLGNLLKDSNGEVRLALNSSLLGSGAHTVTIEMQGLGAGQYYPAAWSRFEVDRPPR